MSESILDARPEEAARRLSLGFIDEARAAADRLLLATDPEALHDLRVALRRLRSTMRAYREVLRGSVPGRRRRALAELTRATGDARDAEVQLAWAEGLAASDSAGSSGDAADLGRTHLAGFLGAQKSLGYQRLNAEILPAIVTLLPRLRADLTSYSVEHVVFERPPEHAFRNLLGRLIRAEVLELESALRAVQGPGGEAKAHEGRIHGKRVRYLIEPFKDELPRGSHATKALRGLQELLGELNDLAVRTQSLRRALEHTAQERARQLADEAVESEVATRRSSVGAMSAPVGPAPEPPRYDLAQEGLLILLKRVLTEKQTTLERLEREWLNGAYLDNLLAELRTLADSLEHASAPREIERKYLLSALPPHVKAFAPSRIDQGYLPGEALIERIRRIKSAEGERYVRTVKLGRGISRVEVEEACGRDVFQKLWSLTVGRRVEKHRYAIPEGEHVWEVDEFLDRGLVLCEVELESELDAPAFPTWLAPFVVREVTDEPAYVNAVLAK